LQAAGQGGRGLPKDKGFLCELWGVRGLIFEVAGKEGIAIGGGGGSM